MAFPSNRPPTAAHGDEPDACRIGVLEGNRTVASRVARILSCATGFSDVVVSDDADVVRDRLSPSAALIACDADRLPTISSWVEAMYPSAQMLVWTSGPMAPVLQRAAMNHAITCMVSWPSFETTPRSWELSLAARRICDPELPPPRLAELFGWGSTVVKYRPRTSADLDAVVAEVSWLGEKAGAPSRTAARLGEIAHELLMNAMYDAPVDDAGRVRYAHDRKAAVNLEDQELPTFRLASDGVTLALQVVDNFGRLKRAQVLKSISRGLAVSEGSDDNVLDTSSGGAGLGLFRIYSGSAATVFEVEPGSYTMVTAFFDLNLNARDARTIPSSLHFYG